MEIVVTPGLVRRFWENVDKRGPVPPGRSQLGPCWLWTAALDTRGYGRIGVYSAGARMGFAHRVSYQINRGNLVPNLCVLHSCDNPRCVNPSHLRLGTQRDNMAEMRRKGRHPGNRSRLNPESVFQIRTLRAAGSSLRELATRFSVSEAHISNIYRGKRWGGALNVNPNQSVWWQSPHNV